MGLIYISSDSEQLMNALKANIASGKEASNQLKSGSEKVISAVDGRTLSGAAYTAGKGLFSDLIIPTINKVTSAIDSLEKELSTYTNYNSKVSGEGTLNEDRLRQQIIEKKAMKMAVDASAEVAKMASRNNPVAKVLDSLLNVQHTLNRLSNTYEQDIIELQKKLEKLQQFSSDTSSLFNDSLSNLKLAMQGVMVLNNTIINSDGSYQLPEGTDKSWFNQAKDGTKMKKMEQKQAFIQSLQNQFGFDEATATQIYKIKEGIDKKFPELSQKERDYLLARILGEFSYGDNLKNKLMWNNTAGRLSDYFYSTITHYSGEKLKVPKDLQAILSDLGLSDKEYKELYYNLRLQHLLSAGNVPANELNFSDYENAKKSYEIAYGKISDEKFTQFWNQKLSDFNKSGDYTHQSITIATIMDEHIRAANVTGVYTGRFDSQSVDEIAGWKGDTTKQALTSPSIGNDDYKADLDAVNITQRMKDKNISFTQASNEYYDDLSNDQTNRAEEFKNNSGYNYVKNEILNSLAPKDNYDYTEEEKLEYVRLNYPDSYNFIESIKNNENEYTDYTNKGR